MTPTQHGKINIVQKIDELWKITSANLTSADAWEATDMADKQPGCNSFNFPELLYAQSYLKLGNEDRVGCQWLKIADCLDAYPVI